jgi:hypothetical protein
MRIGTGAVTASFCTLAVCGCGLGKSVTAPPNSGATGTWELVRVNASQVPVTFTSRGTAFKILYEVIFLRPDQTFSIFTLEKVGDVSSATPGETVNNYGYWEVTGGELLIGIAPAIQTGDTITIRSNSRGMSVYARR